MRFSSSSFFGCSHFPQISQALSQLYSSRILYFPEKDFFITPKQNMNERHQIHNLRTFHEKNVHTSPKSVEGWIFSLEASPVVLSFCQSVVSFVSIDSKVIMFGILLLRFRFKLGRVQLTLQYLKIYPNSKVRCSQYSYCIHWQGVCETKLCPECDDLHSHDRYCLSCFKGSLTSTACVKDGLAVSVDAD